MAKIALTARYIYLIDVRTLPKRLAGMQRPLIRILQLPSHWRQNNTSKANLSLNVGLRIIFVTTPLQIARYMDILHMYLSMMFLLDLIQSSSSFGLILTSITIRPINVTETCLRTATSAPTHFRQFQLYHCCVNPRSFLYYASNGVEFFVFGDLDC